MRWVFRSMTRTTLVWSLCGVLMWLVSPFSLAIVDNEVSAGSSLSEGWSRKFRFSHSSSSGNTDTMILGATFSVEKHHLFSSSTDSIANEVSENHSDPNQFIHRFRILGSYDLQETNDEKVKNVSYLHTRWTEMQSRFWGYETFMQNEFNEFKRINNRLLLGIGLRFDVYRTLKTGFWFGTGYMYERKELDVDDFPDEEETESSNRWANYMTIIKRMDENRLVFQNTLYYQPDFEESDDYEVFNNMNVSYKINKHVSVGMQMLYQYDSQPPTSIEKTDRNVKSFISVSF